MNNTSLFGVAITSLIVLISGTAQATQMPVMRPPIVPAPCTVSGTCGGTPKLMPQPPTRDPVPIEMPFRAPPYAPCAISGTCGGKPIPIPQPPTRDPVPIEMPFRAPPYAPCAISGTCGGKPIPIPQPPTRGAPIEMPFLVPGIPGNTPR